MGTRSLTYIYEEDARLDSGRILCMYRHYDGYPSGHGKELADFLKSITMVKGLGAETTQTVANGMGCLAAQLVVHFKNGPGGIYLYHPDIEDDGVDYEYHVYYFAGAFHIVVNNWEGYSIFAGPLDLFNAFCSEED